MKPFSYAEDLNSQCHEIDRLSMGTEPQYSRPPTTIINAQYACNLGRMVADLMFQKNSSISKQNRTEKKLQKPSKHKIPSHNLLG